MKKTCFVLIILNALVTLAINANENKDYFFSQLGVKDGLSQTSVLCMFEGKDGYLWFGTKNGLNRYDGYEFFIFQNEINNLNSISDNYILSINQDSNKNIWVGTDNGLNCIKYQTETITRFYPQDFDSTVENNKIVKLIRNSENILYALTEHSIFECQKNRQIKKIDLSQVWVSPATTISTDLEGNLYIGTERNGIYVYNKNWQLINHIDYKIENESLALPEKINTILPIHKPFILFGTENNGIGLYNTSTKHIIFLNNLNSNLTSNTITALSTLNDNQILIGTLGGLYRCYLETFMISPIKAHLINKEALEPHPITSMLIDSNHILWLGTLSGGINYYSPYLKPIHFIGTDKFTGIIRKGVEDRQGNIWFATEGRGLLHFQPGARKIKFYPIDTVPQKYYQRNIIKSVLLQGDTIYCSNPEGIVYTFSLQSKKFNKLYDFEGKAIYSLYADSKNRLWIPLNNDGDLHVIENGKIESLFPVNGKLVQFKNVSVIQEIHPDCFLFGTFNGSIYLYDYQKSSLTNLSDYISGEKYTQIGRITSLVVDDTTLWVGTTKGGLYRFNKKLELLKNYQRIDGFPESNINNIIKDIYDNIYAITIKDIYKLNKQEDVFHQVKLKGYPPQEFTVNSCFVASDGMMYFPGNKGIYFFNPKYRKYNPIPPPVYITDLIINNQITDSLISLVRTELSPRYYKYSVKLNHRQNNVGFRYCALNYIHSEENRFAFKLEGVDDDWKYVQTQHEIYYSKLQPGKYTFRLKGANNEGVWNPKETIVAIHITPPFYKTVYAYILYGILFFLIVSTILRYENKKKELKHEIRYKQLEQQKTNELYEERRRMFANFSHELKAPLTLIINPLNDLIKNSHFSQEINDILQLIKKQTSRMMLLVNNLADIQKHEAGIIILQKRRFNFSRFVDEIYKSFEKIATRKEISFSIMNHLPNEYYVCYDQLEIEKAFFNVLSNAFKYTPRHGKINYLITTIQQKQWEGLLSLPDQYKNMLYEKSYILITVTDSGKGIEKKDIEKIFEPFYRQEKDIHQDIPGTGMGLALTRSIILQHNGIIWAESNQTNGGCFHILLPDTESQGTTIQSETENITSPILINKVSDILLEAETYSKKTILIIDDNKEIVNYLEQQLEEEYVVIKAYNGKAGFELIKKTPPDLIISDIGMPELNGIDLCKIIKSDPRFYHIPVILITARSMISQITEGLDAEADDYITKPFDITVVKARIKNILSIREKMKSFYSDMNVFKSLKMEDQNEEKEFITKYIEIIKTNISDPELNVSVICDELGMSRANFYRKVKQTTGLSPIEFIKTIRMEAAAKLLKETTMNISEIAQSTGFGNRSSFSKSFKSTYGMAPLEYRKTIE